MTPNTIVATIMTTNAYRRWRYERMLRMTLITAATLAFTLVAGTTIWSKPNRVEIFQTDVMGRIKTPIPLSRPNVDDEGLKRWATEAIVQIHSFDFANYREQMQDNRRYLTEGGWRGFEQGLQASGNFQSILHNNYVVTAVPAGPPVILSQGGVPLPTGGSRYGWTVELPIVVTYQSSRQEIAQRISVTATIGRMPEQGTSGMGLGIRQVLSR